MGEHDIDFRRPLPFGFLASDVTRQSTNEVARTIAASAQELLSRLAGELREEDLRLDFRRRLPLDGVEVAATAYAQEYKEYMQRQKSFLRDSREASSVLHSPSEQKSRWEDAHRSLHAALNDGCRKVSL